MAARQPAMVNQTRAFIALVASAFAMGLSPTFVRLAEVGPFASAFWRVALALPILYLWMRSAEKAEPDASRTSFTPMTLLAGLAFAGDLFFWHLAIGATTVANATFFATTAPIFVILIVALIFREHISKATLIGLGLCLCGGAALIGQSMDIAPARLRGDLYGIATAVFFALYFIAIGKARAATNAARLTFEASLITAGILAVIALALEPRMLPASGKGIAAILAMALISHAGGQGLLAIALGRLSPVFSSLVIFLEAIVAALFGWLILSEALTWIQAAGGGLILSGIWFARPRGPQQQSDTTQAGT
jgi:drug/metabolite transporter (DMT)-like permease